MIYFSTSSAGSNMFKVISYSHYATLPEAGGQFQDITPTSFSIRTGSAYCALKYDPSASYERRFYGSGYYRIIAIALE